jgi:hypothetical protein
MPISVVDPKQFFVIRIPFCYEFWIRLQIWIRILLDLQKVPETSSGSDPEYSLFHNANYFKSCFMAF